MRTIDSTLKTLQQSNNRYPISKLEFYHTIPQFTECNYPSSGTRPTFLPAYWDSEVQNACMDMDYYNGTYTIMGTLEIEEVYYNVAVETTDFVSFPLVYFAYSDPGWLANGQRRGSIQNGQVYGIIDTGIQNYNVFSSARGVPTSGGTGWQYPLACAAVDDGEVYVLLPYPEQSFASDIDANIEALSLAYIDNDGYSLCNYVIPVSEGYHRHAGNFFDAVRLEDGTDVILVNLANSGDPRIILHRNDIWSTPYHVLPIDIVDNYSFLRLGWLKYYDGVIYATGTLGRAGSTGAYPQEMGVVLKSTDGLRWSLDRYHYLGQSPFASPLVMDDDYMYTLRGPSAIYRADRTPPFGGYNHKVTVMNEILSWSNNETNHGGAGTLAARLANSDYRFTDSSSSDYICSGDMIKLYAGYATASDHYLLLGTYGIDQIVPDAEMQIQAREWAYRQLKDVAFDQDWQWLSQTKHYDPCINMAGLYSVGEALPKVDDDLGIKNAEYNKLILLATAVKPQNEDYNIEASFSITNTLGTLFGLGLREADASEIEYKTHQVGDYGDPLAAAEANSYVYTSTLLGTGFGVFGYYTDKYNFLAAFCDVINGRLYLLRRAGSSDANASFEVLDSEPLAIAPAIAQRFLVSMDSVQSELTIKVEQWGIVSSKSSKLGTTTVSTRYVDYDACKSNTVGIIEYLRVPESKVTTTQPDAGFLARDWSFWAGTDSAHHGLWAHNQNPSWEHDRVPESAKDRFFEWKKNGPLLIGNEELEIASMTETQWAGAYTYTWSVNTYKPSTVVQHSGDTTPPEGTLEGGTKSEYTRLFIRGLRNDPLTGCTRIENFYETYTPLTAVTRPNIGWFICPIEGKGIGKVGEIISYRKNYAFPLGGSSTTNCESIRAKMSLFGRRIAASTAIEYDGTIYWWPDIDGDQQKLSVKSTEFSVTYYSLLPGFQVLKNGIDRAASPGNYYNPQERILQHYNDAIILHEVVMYDYELDKSMDWTIKDIAIKAGILNFSGASNFDDTDYDFRVAPMHPNEIVIDRTYNEFNIYNETDSALVGEVMTYYGSAGVNRLGGPYLSASIAMPTSGYLNGLDSTTTEENQISKNVTLYDIVGKFTVTGKDNFVSLWLENLLVGTLKVRSIMGITSPTSISSTLLVSNTSLSQQYELYRAIDGIVADQGMAAFDAAMRVIRDARVKLLPTSNGGLKVSAFKYHPDLGTIPDIIYAIQEQLSDRIPTHVRAVGEEIAEYFDHEQAARFGILFHTLNIESLSEEESYHEAQATVMDALSYSEGITQHVAAQLEYEVEDRVTINVETYDNRIIQQTYIIDSIERSFAPAQLEMTARCRRKYD